MNAPLLELRGIRKALGGQEVLRGVDLFVRRHETLVVMGRSGGGKSVTLRIIMGLLRADEGTVHFDHHNLTQLDEEALNPFRKRMGMLFQDGALFDSMDVEDNLAFPLREDRAHRLSEKEIRQRVQGALELVELSGHGKKMPSELSGGMRKRVGLARAAITQPELVLYDEPTSGLDPIVSASINQLILRLREKLQVSSIVVTHDIASALAIADRICFLHQGRIYWSGTPHETQQCEDPWVKSFVEGKILPDGENDTLGTPEGGHSERKQS